MLAKVTMKNVPIEAAAYNGGVWVRVLQRDLLGEVRTKTLRFPFVEGDQEQHVPGLNETDATAFDVWMPELVEGKPFPRPQLVACIIEREIDQ